MKNTIYILSCFLLLALMFQSCEDLEEVLVPNFEVAFNATAKVGEPIEFKVENTPNFLNFYSGEFGHEYKNSERATAEGNFSLSFDTSRHYMDGTSSSDNAWSLLVSTDYSGSGTIEDVQSATWTDISDRYVFATARTHTPTDSGTADISDLASDLPTYFAFRFYAEGKKSEGNRQGVLRLSSFDISLAVADEDYSLDIASVLSPGFKPVNVEGVHPTNATKDFWRNRGSFYELNADQAEYVNDDWLITEPVNLSGSVSPDRGTSLKTYSEKLDSFSYTYTKAGTYTASVIGNNSTVYGHEEQLIEFTIEVTD